MQISLLSEFIHQLATDFESRYLLMFNEEHYRGLPLHVQSCCHLTLLASSIAAIPLISTLP